MDPKLHRQLDHLENLEVEQERERLACHFEALHGHPAPSAWIEAALQSEATPPPTAVAVASPEPPQEAPTIATPSWWPKFLEAPATLVFRTRIAGGAAMSAAGLCFGISGWLGKTGLDPDNLINLNASFQHQGALWLLGGALCTPWKGIRDWFKKEDRWLWSRQGRHAKKWVGWPVMGLVIPAMTVGALHATLSEIRQIIPVSASIFDTYKTQKTLLDQIFQVNKDGVSALPLRVAHDSPTCQLFRAQLDDIDAHPTTELGQLLNGAQAGLGYNRGCLTDQELFARENNYWARAQAWSMPAFLPHQTFVHQIIADQAGLNSRKWCTITNEWPANTTAEVRATTCENLPATHLDHSVTLASMGVKVPPAP